MMRELTEKDFARGIRNPHYEKIMTKIEIAITREDLATFGELSKLNGFPVELIIRNCLADFAEEIRSDD
ncbi:MAG: hypothetical protein FWC89_01765 [Defluviitaleaceae bacterium]|nr:hypothetical protein [Defluviitaleaceae bacterium]